MKEDSKILRRTEGEPGAGLRVVGYFEDFREICVCAALPPFDSYVSEVQAIFRRKMKILTVGVVHSRGKRGTHAIF